MSWRYAASDGEGHAERVHRYWTVVEMAVLLGPFDREFGLQRSIARKRSVILLGKSYYYRKLSPLQ